MLMVWCKTTVTPLLMHWSYCSLALSHWYITKIYQIKKQKQKGPDLVASLETIEKQVSKIWNVGCPLWYLKIGQYLDALQMQQHYWQLTKTHWDSCHHFQDILHAWQMPLAWWSSYYSSFHRNIWTHKCWKKSSIRVLHLSVRIFNSLNKAIHIVYTLWLWLWFVYRA